MRGGGTPMWPNRLKSGSSRVKEDQSKNFEKHYYLFLQKKPSKNGGPLTQNWVIW